MNLIDALRASNDKLEVLLSLIPPELYLHQAQPLPDADQTALLSKSARKKLKFDPSRPKTVLDIQKVRAAQHNPTKQNTTAPVHQLSKQELKEKLHAKIAALSDERKKRASEKDAPSSNGERAPTPGGRQAMIAQAQAERLAQKQAAKKDKRKAQRAEQAAVKEALRADEPQQKSKGKRKADVSVDEDAPSLSQDTAVVKHAAAAPEADDNVTFSHLDFADSATIRPVDDLRPNKKTKRDPQAALEKLKDRRKFLAKLTPQAKERAEEKDRWSKAEKQAEGGKVLDEEARLRKMAKRKEKQKEVSRKDWASREKSQADQQAARQKQRTANLKARSQANKDRKTGGKKKSQKPTGGKKLSSQGKKASGRNDRGFEMSMKAKANAKAGAAKSGKRK